MSHDLPQDVIDSIRTAIFAGRKIEAIKLYRDATGQGLKEAKEFIEELADRLYEEDPEKFTSVPGKGCAGVVLAMFVVCAAMVVGW
jgi:hypothetical protein